ESNPGSFALRRCWRNDVTGEYFRPFRALEAGLVHISRPRDPEGTQDPRKDVLTCQAILGCEVDRSVQLEHDPPAVAIWEEVDADEVYPDRGRRTDGALTRLRRWSDRVAAAAERHVRPPLARRSQALRRSHDLPGRHEDPQVMPLRYHEL